MEAKDEAWKILVLCVLTERASVCVYVSNICILANTPCTARDIAMQNLKMKKVTVSTAPIPAGLRAFGASAGSDRRAPILIMEYGILRMSTPSRSPRDLEYVYRYGQLEEEQRTLWNLQRESGFGVTSRVRFQCR